MPPCNHPHCIGPAVGAHHQRGGFTTERAHPRVQLPSNDVHSLLRLHLGSQERALRQCWQRMRPVLCRGVDWRRGLQMPFQRWPCQWRRCRHCASRKCAPLLPGCSPRSLPSRHSGHSMPQEVTVAGEAANWRKQQMHFRRWRSEKRCWRRSRWQTLCQWQGRRGGGCAARPLGHPAAGSEATHAL